MSDNKDIGKGIVEFGTNVTNELGKIGQHITNYSTDFFLTPENVNKRVEQNATSKEKLSQKTPSPKTSSQESKRKTLEQDIENKKTRKPEKKTIFKSTFNKLRSLFKSKKKSTSLISSPKQRPTPSQRPFPSQTPFPSQILSASRRSSPLKGSTEFFHSIKNEINILFYEIVELILQETILIAKKKKPVTTKLQENLQFLINMDYNKLMANLQIIKVKKEKLEETLLILSTIVKANCEGTIASFGCNTGATLNGILKIYKFLKDCNSVTDNITGKMSNANKLEFIKNAYNYNDLNLNKIKTFASGEFNSKVNKFIEIVIPILNEFINPKSVYIELQQFSDKYEKIKKNYYLNNSTNGGRKKKESKKNTKTKSGDKKKTTKKNGDKKKTTKKNGEKKKTTKKSGEKN